MMEKKFAVLVACAVVLLGFVLTPSLGTAQTRVNDKDLESLMRNLRDDAKSFQPSFNDAAKRSVIRKTSQEKDAKDLVARFVKQTESMLNRFKSTKKADRDLPNVLGTAAQIDKIVSSLTLNPQTMSRWQRVRAELHQVSSAYGMPDPLDTVASMPAGGETPCWQSVGQQRAQTLVAECTRVSPAAHPPCNAENACSLITDEIRRGCGLIGSGAPSFCAEYR